MSSRESTLDLREPFVWDDDNPNEYLYFGPATEPQPVRRGIRWHWYALAIATGIIAAAYVDSLRIPLPWYPPLLTQDRPQALVEYPAVNARYNALRSETEAADSVMVQGDLKLPPMSRITITFKEPFAAAPSVYLRNASFVPSFISIESVNEKQMVILNKDEAKECQFQYVADGSRAATMTIKKD